MATTTASITITSSDLLTDALSLSSSMTLYQDGTTATGLDECTYSRHNIPTGTNFDLVPESAALTEDASYVYICNKSTDVTYYVIISINDEVIGRLYAGDWMFIPWSGGSSNNVQVAPSVASSMKLEYVLVHE